MNRSSLTAGLLAATLASTSAYAQDSGVFDDRFYIAPSLFYIYTDDDLNADDGVGFRLDIGKPISKSMNLELSGYFSELDADQGGDLTLVGGGLAALIFPDREASPFFGILGIHQGKLDLEGGPVTGDVDSNALDVGLGYMERTAWKVPLLDQSIMYRGELRYRYEKISSSDANAAGIDNSYHDVLLSLGFAIPIGADPVAAAEEEEARVVALAAADADGDGVPDNADQCPGTPSGVAVDSKGCERDEDGDGVVDRKDKCPGTPPGRAVDSTGCPFDSDGDGVADAVDACPNSPEGAKVLADGCALVGDCRRPRAGAKMDENGCAIGGSIILRGVNFEFDRDRLTANAKVILDQVADALLGSPEVSVLLTGHTDGRGPDSYNKDLSARRANSVSKYLEGRGISSDRITTKGMGESKPIATNDNEAGRELNRRVELSLM